MVAAEWGSLLTSGRETVKTMALVWGAYQSIAERRIIELEGSKNVRDTTL